MQVKTTPFKWSKLEKSADYKEFAAWKTAAYKELEKEERHAFNDWLDIWGEDIYNKNDVCFQNWVTSTDVNEVIQAFRDSGGEDQPELELFRLGRSMAQLIDEWWFEVRYTAEYELFDKWYALTGNWDMEDVPLAFHAYLEDYSHYQQFYFGKTFLEWTREVTPEDFVKSFWDNPNHEEYLNNAYRHTTPQEVFDKIKWY
jgi:hypothetical protein